MSLNSRLESTKAEEEDEVAHYRRGVPPSIRLTIRITIRFTVKRIRFTATRTNSRARLPGEKRAGGHHHPSV